ncbi:cellulose biosynthesis cyclic di-GMP-binding regulatory protein BcsB [Ammonifex thiophilus]|uniref:Cellulose synthase n=1 Tax=Ammonifex thiophilus TaxID=444093 RepID=A0A3D8P3L8_9THEO|nr:cellulose biosynthesis cyclic di-GMP-binding regulatory protein BcsB [Ammonifex thiophilus]RDV81218.1 hypothetical protein DXX99_09550 [Ammonifex thiophilus]
MLSVSEKGKTLAKAGIFTGTFFLTVFCFAVLLSPAFPEKASGQTEENTQIFTLARLGYPHDIQLGGSDPSFVFYVPVTPGMGFGKSAINLHLTFSPVLDPNSSIKVFVADSPVYTALLGDLRDAGQEVFVKVPLAGITPPPVPGVLKIEVRMHIFITDNICQDLATGNLWVVLHNDTSVTLAGVAQQPRNIADFLGGSFDRVYLVAPRTISAETATCYLKTYAFLRRFFRDKGVAVEVLPFGETPTAGPAIVIEDSGNSLHLDEKGVLHLGPGAADAFISSYRSLFLGKEIGIGVARASEAEETPVKISFEDLGYSPVTVRGIGDLKATYTFTLSDVGGRPANMRLVLFGRYTPLASDKDRLYLKIYLNGFLLKALPLGREGEINGFSVPIPDYALRQENTLELVYSYYPEVGNCVKGTMPFEGLFCNRSYLEVSGHRRDEYLSFSSIPGSFIGSAYVVLPEQDVTPYLLAAGNMLAAVRQMDRVPIQVQVAFASTGRDIEGALKKVEKGWVLFALPPDLMKEFHPPVDASGGKIVIYNPLTQERVFEAAADEPFGIAQVFYVFGKVPAVALSFHGQGTSEMQALARQLVNPDNLRRLRGNVAFCRDDQLVGFDVGKKMRARVEGEGKDLWYYYHRYRVPIFVGLLVVLSVLAYLVYIRLARYPARH